MLRIHRAEQCRICASTLVSHLSLPLSEGYAVVRDCLATIIVHPMNLVCMLYLHLCARSLLVSRTTSCLSMGFSSFLCMSNIWRALLVSSPLRVLVFQPPQAANFRPPAATTLGYSTLCNLMHLQREQASSPVAVPLHPCLSSFPVSDASNGCHQPINVHLENPSRGAKPQFQRSNLLISMTTFPIHDT